MILTKAVLSGMFLIVLSYWKYNRKSVAVQNAVLSYPMNSYISADEQK